MGAWRWMAAASLALVLGSGCVSNGRKEIRTEVVTFPKGGIVEYNGTELGRAPKYIILPQDENGRLTERAVLRVLPEEEQHVTRTKMFEVSDRMDRIPDRIMLDLTGNADTNAVPSEVAVARREAAPKPRYKYTPRSKPSQVVGIDRENTQDSDPP